MKLSCCHLMQALCIRHGDASIAVEVARYLPSEIIETFLLSETTMESYMTLHTDGRLTDGTQWNAAYV